MKEGIGAFIAQITPHFFPPCRHTLERCEIRKRCTKSIDLYGNRLEEGEALKVIKDYPNHFIWMYNKTVKLETKLNNMKWCCPLRSVCSLSLFSHEMFIKFV